MEEDVCSHNHTGIRIPGLAPHVCCDECEALSLSPKQSDFFICHLCGGLQRRASARTVKKDYRHRSSPESDFPIHLRMLCQVSR
jgi:hypothetical protein